MMRFADEVQDGDCDKDRGEVCDRVHDRVHDKVHDEVRDEVRDKVCDKVRDEVHGKVCDKALEYGKMPFSPLSTEPGIFREYRTPTFLA